MNARKSHHGRYSHLLMVSVTLQYTVRSLPSDRQDQCSIWNADVLRSGTPVSRHRPVRTMATILHSTACACMQRLSYTTIPKAPEENFGRLGNIQLLTTSSRDNSGSPPSKSTHRRESFSRCRSTWKSMVSVSSPSIPCGHWRPV